MGSWRLSRAVSCRNSCLKEIAVLTVLGKSALIPAISSFPKASPHCPEQIRKETCVCSLIFPVFWKGKWRLANRASVGLLNDLHVFVSCERAGLLSPVPHENQQLEQH